MSSLDFFSKNFLSGPFVFVCFFTSPEKTKVDCFFFVVFFAFLIAFLEFSETKCSI